MNHRTSGLKTEKAITGFLQHKAAEGCSTTTLTSYTQHLKVWGKYVGAVDVGAVTAPDLRAFLAWLRSDYQPRRFDGSSLPLSAKTLRNYWVTLSAFFRWATEEFDLTNPMRSVPAPHFEEAPVEPFTQREVELLLKACEFCREARTTDRQSFIMRRRTVHRDRAIILTLLDTGLRASELCALSVGEVDLKTGQVRVKHGQCGGAKGGVGRLVYLGKAARRALWRYLANRADGEHPDTPLFLGKLQRRLNKGVLRQLIARLGAKAGVTHAHPHRFRHTFALAYLRSGGDVFTLQALLGHSTLEMVQHYARIALLDVAEMHRKASPVDNWHL